MLGSLQVPHQVARVENRVVQPGLDRLQLLRHRRLGGAAAQRIELHLEADERLDQAVVQLTGEAGAFDVADVRAFARHEVLAVHRRRDLRGHPAQEAQRRFVAARRVEEEEGCVPARDLGANGDVGARGLASRKPRCGSAGTVSELTASPSMTRRRMVSPRTAPVCQIDAPAGTTGATRARSGSDSSVSADVAFDSGVDALTRHA